MSLSQKTSGSYVVDASFVLQALLDHNEIVSTRFEQVFSEKTYQQIMAPELLKLEVRNGLRFSISDVALTQEVLTAFTQLPIEYLPASDFLLDQAVAMSQKHKTSVYDSLYHGLALQQKATFITCDKKYYLAAKMLGSIELVSST